MVGQENHEEREQLARLNAKSHEDEKIVNTKKLKEDFFAAMKALLAKEHWKCPEEFDVEMERFDIMQGDQKLGVEFNPDGLSVVMHDTSEESLRMSMEVMTTYQTVYEKHHKETLEFELICNDEEEARNIIKHCLEHKLNVTTLQFFTDDPDKNEDKSELLKTILKDLKPDAGPDVSPDAPKQKDGLMAKAKGMFRRGR